MYLNALIQRPVPPVDWTRWRKIPWDDPAFSRRMLAQHLSQEHDWASRKSGIISRHVDYMHTLLPEGGGVLDLGCGPGLYTERLYHLGHPCTGVDFSPASVAYARALPGGRHITYVQEDIRRFRTDEQFDAVLLLFGEINAFSRDDAFALLAFAAARLKPGGKAFVETHAEDAVRASGSRPPLWQSFASGLFSDSPHLCLEEHFWNESHRAAMTRYFVLDAATAVVSEFASLMRAYTQDEYHRLFREAGFRAAAPVPDADWPVGEDFDGRLCCYVCEI